LVQYLGHALVGRNRGIDLAWRAVVDLLRLGHILRPQQLPRDLDVAPLCRHQGMGERKVGGQGFEGVREEEEEEEEGERGEYVGEDDMNAKGCNHTHVVATACKGVLQLGLAAKVDERAPWCQP
jgi:hypothetical protein